MPQDSSISPDPDGTPAGVFGFPKPEYRPRWWLHWLLFGLTLFFTTLFGGGFFGWMPQDLLEADSITLVLLDLRFWTAGLKFSVPLLLAWLLDGRQDRRVWRDGRVVKVPADQIEVREPQRDYPAPAKRKE